MAEAMLNNKFGWLMARLGRFRRRWRMAPSRASDGPVRTLRIPLLLVAAAMIGGAAAPAAIVYAGGAWAAIDRGGACEALARSARIAAKGKVQAVAGFTFSRDRRRWGEFHAQLSQVPRLGSSVMLDVGGQPFLLVTSGGRAWSRGPLQEQAIIAALRNAAAIRVEARDPSGSRFADPYVLDGAPTAIDAAAARCAGKMLAR
jgi:hypothetical protein